MSHRERVNIYSLNIHPTAIVHPAARIGRGVEIGPYCLVGENVEIGADTKLLAHVVVNGHTIIGKECQIHPFAVIGGTSQDKKFKGEISYVRIGDRNVIREFVTINRGTGAESETVVGDDNHLLAYVHIAHNCVIGNRVIMSNLSQLAGHVNVGDGANIGGMAGVHQFVRIGRMAMVGGYSKVKKDVLPFATVEGNPASLRSLNLKGLERARVASEAVAELKEAYRLLRHPNMTLATAVEQLRQVATSSEGQELLAFLETESDRGVLKR